MWLKINTFRLNQFPMSCSNPLILDATRYLTTGDNVLYVTVLNIGAGGSSTASNPAGLIYFLNITYSV